MHLLLASPLGLLIGLALGALGGGGSILAVPILVFVVGLSPTEATSASLVVVGAASAIGASLHWRAGRVLVVPGLTLGAVGVAGSLAGSALNRRLDGDVLLLGFAGLMLVAAWRIAAGCPSCTRVGEERALQAEDAANRDPNGARGIATRIRRMSLQRLSVVVAAGTAVGFLTGLFGVGGGFMIVPALVLALGFAMPQAVGTSLLVIALNAAVALTARLGTAVIDWPTTLVFGATAVTGVLAGTRIAGRVDARALQRGFVVLLVAVAVYTGVRAL